MLRRRVPVQRNPSICTFCQNRLALRQARPQFHQRLLSTTSALRDDGSESSKQDGPATASSWGSSVIPGGSRGWGSSPTFASPNPSAEPDLLPHELAARRRLQEEQKKKEEAAVKPPDTKGPRAIFNPERQQQNRRFLKNEQAEITANRLAGRYPPPPPGKPTMPGPQSLDFVPPKLLRKNWAAPAAGLAHSKAPIPSRIKRQVGRNMDSPATPKFSARLGPRPNPYDVAKDNTIQSSEPRETPARPLVRQVAFGARKADDEASATTGEKTLDNTLYTRDAWKDELSSGKPKMDPVLEEELLTSHRHFDGLFDDAPEKPKDTSAEEPEVTSTWGSLARKEASEKSSEDFWAKMDTFTRPAQSAQPAQPVSQPASTPSGTCFEKEFDNAFYKSEKPSGIKDNAFYKSSDSWDSQSPKQGNDAWPSYNPNRQPGKGSSSTASDFTSKQSPTDATNTSGKGRRKARGKNEWDDEPAYEESQQTPQRNDYSGRGGKQRGGRGGGGGRGGSRFEDALNDEDTHAAYEEQLARQREKAERKARKEAERTGPIPIVLPDLISISNLASALKVEKELFLEQLAELGFEGVHLDSIMAGDTAGLVAQEYGYEPTIVSETEDLKARPPPADPSVLPPRPPVVTIMGHVDHGKTTLLDYLRKASVALQEHGGITQHIGAFSVNLTDGKNITFLDTPGHAAFLTMRQRGANVTDIVVLVVAADDSVKPQTIEAIKHARAAKVPIIVAINKIDKEGARIDHCKADLATNGVEIEDYGGDVQVVCVSGKTGQGMDDLEENILALAEMLDMRAETDGPAEGWILESSLKPIGRAATILVKRGTLRPGDYIAAGTTWAKIRHLRNEAGDEITEAPPGTPVEILGWRDLPSAGDEVIQAPDENRAKIAVDYRANLRDRENDAKAHEQIVEQRRLLQEQRALEEEEESGNGNGKSRREYGTWGTTEAAPVEGGAKMVNFVVKGDVHGSVEAVCASILEIGSNEVQPRILRSAPGHIIESDVEHAAASRSTLVNFNLPIMGHIKALAEANGVPILDHTVIYHLHDDVRDVLSAQLTPEVSIKVLGEAEVLQVFPINVKARKFKNIAGCRIRNGAVAKANRFKVVRGGQTVYDGELESLKQGKKDIMDAKKGGECGIGFQDFQEFEVGDLIQAYENVETKRSL
ncbi:translation initiation factor IF-2 [Apiospora arundinis]|uniref:Translation initiation factor IF-2, mitochondrial n=1 Tax=Apiospora arundinis TaxID=335852 RepID=A0ABR2JLP8_9PEZI